MEPSFDLTKSLGPVKKPPTLSGAVLKPLAFWNRLRSSPSNSSIAVQDVTAPLNIQQFPMDGLKVSAFVNFIAVCGGEKKIRYLSTKQVVERYILPVTNATKSSYCELVKARDPSVIGRSSVYISHSWGARFMDTYRAIKYHFRNQPDAFLWLDIFSLDQRVFYPLQLQQRARHTYTDMDGDATTEMFSLDGFEGSVASANRTTLTSAPAYGQYDNKAAFGPSTESTAKGYSQWSGIYTGGEAGDWCADILKHGMDKIGHVVLVLNSSPNPEPKTGILTDDPRPLSPRNADGTIPNSSNNRNTNTNVGTLATHSTDADETEESEETGNIAKWDRSRFLNPSHALSRLWVLYEIYCTTVDRSHSEPSLNGTESNDLPARSSLLSPIRIPSVSQTNSQSNSRTGSRQNSRQGARNQLAPLATRRNKSGIIFDIALHYSMLEDAASHTTSANIKNKRSPFNVDLQGTCLDLENLTKWICGIDLNLCSATDRSDAERLLSIIHVDIGANVFINTVKEVLHTWVTDMMNENSTETTQLTNTMNNTYYNSSTSKQRLYVQHSLFNLFHIKGDSVRAEGAMIELGEQQKAKYGPYHPDYLDTLQYLADYYIKCARMNDAEPVLIECLEGRKFALGAQHADTVHTMDTLANLYDVTGSPHLAEPLYAECYETRKATLSPTHISTLRAMYNLSCMMFIQDELTHAEALMRECLNLRREALGGTHADTMESLQKLAVLHELRQEYPVAELLYHEYLLAANTVYGPDNINTLKTLYLLGTNYRNQYKYNVAEQVLRLVLDKYRATLGAEHDFTMQAMYDLANLYEDVAQYEHSLALRSTYYTLCKSKYGEECVAHMRANHTNSTNKTHNRNNVNQMAAIVEDTSTTEPMKCLKTHQCMYDLAALHIKMGKCSRALPLLVRCLELQQIHIGAYHLDTLATQSMLAMVHINNGNYNEAEALLVRTIEEGNRIAAEERAVVVEEVEEPILTNRTNSRASNRSKVGNKGNENNSHRSPMGLGLNALTHRSNATSSDSEDPPLELPVVLAAMTNLGILYTEQGKLAEAEALFMGTWESYRRLHGDEQHPDVLTVVHNLAGLYVKQKKFELAEFLYTDCLKKRTAVLGGQHPTTLHTLSSLAALFTHMGKCDIAEAMITECQRQCTDTLGADHPTTLRNINNLAIDCEVQGDLRRAETLHKQCLVKRRLSLGATHPETLSSSNNLASCYVKQVQQLKEAERMYKECLKSRQSTIGLHHPDTLSVINNIATLYMRSDRQELALDVYSDCTEECFEQLGSEHPVTLTALTNLQQLADLLNKDINSLISVSTASNSNYSDSDHSPEPSPTHQRNPKLSIHTTPSPIKQRGAHRPMLHSKDEQEDEEEGEEEYGEKYDIDEGHYRNERPWK